MSVESLSAEVARLKSELDGLKATVDHYAALSDGLRSRERELVAEIAELERRVERVKQAAALLHSLSNLSREQLCEHLSRIVTTALQYVYGPDFRFEFELTTDRRGNTKVDYYVVSNGVRTRPQDARGGGVVDVVSIALRVGVLTLMNNPPLPGPIVLDEPGRHLDAESAVRLGEFLRFIAETTGRQVIVVTHHETIVPYAHAAYRVSQAQGVSNIERVI